ncbi:MAG: excinuclease ABC subunit UvrA, partial [Oscillospiraceae bacterium]|nr:excinuclease ABC subunit UvrA [Oscillospiraceae bacterium]
MNEVISVRGARENNLKNVDLTIPRDRFVVFTGLSGSGKSSLAFDTIYAEGQRRYVESLSSYARMFLGQMDKPDVDAIDGLSPAISIDQKTTSKNPRSTVGTVTEIYDYLRLLWARAGVPHCPKCGKEIRKQTIDQVVDKVLQLPEGTRFQVLSPVVRGKKGEHQKVFADARKSGFARVRVDGSLYDLTEEFSLDKNKKHNIELVVDRLVLRGDITRRLTDSIETATSNGNGVALIQRMDGEEELSFSLNYSCEDCGISMPELSPRMFSFNNPYGACPHCAGLGYQLKVDPDLIIPNRSLSILDGAVQASGWGSVKNDSISRMYFDGLASRYHFKLTDPLEKLPPAAMDAILYGTKGEKLTLYYERANGRGTLEQAFEGIVPSLERRYRETQSESMRKELEEYMAMFPCPECGGKRLSPISRAVTVGGMQIMD